MAASLKGSGHDDMQLPSDRRAHLEGQGCESGSALSSVVRGLCHSCSCCQGGWGCPPCQPLTAEPAPETAWIQRAWP